MELFKNLNNWLILDTSLERLVALAVVIIIL